MLFLAGAHDDKMVECVMEVGVTARWSRLKNVDFGTKPRLKCLTEIDLMLT